MALFDVDGDAGPRADALGEPLVDADGEADAHDDALSRVEGKSVREPEPLTVVLTKTLNVTLADVDGDTVPQAATLGEPQVDGGGDEDTHDTDDAVAFTESITVALFEIDNAAVPQAAALGEPVIEGNGEAAAKVEGETVALNNTDAVTQFKLVGDAEPQAGPLGLVDVDAEPQAGALGEPQDEADTHRIVDALADGVESALGVQSTVPVTELDTLGVGVCSGAALADAPSDVDAASVVVRVGDAWPVVVAASLTVSDDVPPSVRVCVTVEGKGNGSG